MDLIINNENEPVSVFKNNARELNHNHFIAISLKGEGKNTFAIGSKVQVFLPDSTLNRELIPSRGFQSSMDYKLVIGLGQAKKIDSIRITWPNRSISTILNPALDRTIFVAETTIPSRPPGIPQMVRKQAMYFDPVVSSFEKHKEDNYIDFYAEYNIPQMLSREGPKATVGDVNGDGLQDIFIGGTAGHPGQLYIQDRKGAFTKKVEADFDKFPDFEDGAVLFFDADKDGDLDLLVCPGGNNMTPNSRESQLRLFINDGRANFILDPNAFPNTGVNVSVAKSFDFNGDGYEDLFVGGLSVPGNYGVTPSSFLLQNDGKGHFRDIAATEYPEIARAGMVTNAQWTDMNGDGKRDLVISGLWMNPQIYLNQNNRFVRLHTNMDSLFGWWQSSIAIDVNGDGKMDLVLGNIGENFYLKPDKEHPAKIWINDFDNNGITDKILTRSINGKDMPVFLKHDLEKQVPGLKKQNLKHGDFARKSIQELFPAMIIEKCIVKQFNFCSSIVAINGGDGKFVIQKLPVRAQLTSIHAIQPFDVNADGNQDLIVAGNEFGFLPQFGRLDGGFGDILLGDGPGHFKAVGQNKTGFNVKGQVRDIAPIEINREPNILFLVNDSIPSLYKIPKRNN